MKRILVSNSPKTWLEFPDDMTQKEIDQKLANYKHLMQEKDNAYKESMKRWVDAINARNVHKYKANGHEIPEFHIDVNKNTNQFNS